MKNHHMHVKHLDVIKYITYRLYETKLRWKYVMLFPIRYLLSFAFDHQAQHCSKHLSYCQFHPNYSILFLLLITSPDPHYPITPLSPGPCASVSVPPNAPTARSKFTGGGRLSFVLPTFCPHSTPHPSCSIALSVYSL